VALLSLFVAPALMIVITRFSPTSLNHTGGRILYHPADLNHCGPVEVSPALVAAIPQAWRSASLA
jgi:hypothetical protein